MIRCPWPITYICDEFMFYGVVADIGHTGSEIFFIVDQFCVIASLEELASSSVFYIEILSIGILETAEKSRKLSYISRENKMKMVREDTEGVQLDRI